MFRDAVIAELTKIHQHMLEDLNATELFLESTDLDALPAERRAALLRISRKVVSTSQKIMEEWDRVAEAGVVEANPDSIQALRHTTNCVDRSVSELEEKYK